MRTHSRLFSALAIVTALTCVAASPGSTFASTEQQHVQAAPGTTWLIASPGDLRLGPPPDEVETQSELAEVQAAADSRDAAALDRIRYWDAGAPQYRWTQRAVKYAQGHGVGGNRAFRMMALLEVAMHDATAATYDTKFSYSRSRPDPALAAIAPPSTPSYPDEHASAAGAAASVLTYLFPTDAELFAGWADEAARSRLEAGVAYPSDIQAGLALGRQVGELAVASGQADGSGEKWSGSVPTEPGKWTGTNPVEPLGGSWKPWALSSGDQFRPGPPPAVDSEQLATELAAVKNYRRTNLTNLTASFWEYYGGRGAFEYWNDVASRLIFEHRLQDNHLAVARIYALANVAIHDSVIACWDAKYTYWAPRPAMLDPTITMLFVTPNHPAYPSAHSCIASAASTVLAHHFPSETASLNAIVDQVGEARIAGGIHFQSDIDAGETLGRRVGEVVLARGQ